jgi:hypothetical protein
MFAPTRKSLNNLIKYSLLAYMILNLNSTHINDRITAGDVVEEMLARALRLSCHIQRDIIFDPEKIQKRTKGQKHI